MAKNGKRLRAKKSARRPRKPVIIDFHAHILCEEVFAETYPLTVIGQRRAEGGGVIHALPEEQRRRMVDLDLRIKDMDAMGVDIQVISPSILHQCTYSLDPQEALRLERINNDHVAETVARKPDRLIGLGCVPLQDGAVAVQEMERCVRDLGLKGIIVGSRVNDWELGDRHLWPFWQRAAELGVGLFMHPAGNADPRLRKHTLLISLGQPLEEAFAMASLVYEGVMDAFPGLKIAFAHGGGFIPFYAGRFDWMYRRGGTKQMKGDFSSYLKKFYYE
jgi:aminocarboxymuconate-semialdehyde decarboxylase